MKCPQNLHIVKLHISNQRQTELTLDGIKWLATWSTITGFDTQFKRSLKKRDKP